MPDLGRLGVWSLELRFGDPAKAGRAAAELDELGYGALWIPGGIGGDLTDDIDRLLTATTRTTIATGILNIWKHDPAQITDWWKRLPDHRRDRVFLGLGVSHAHIVGAAYGRPLAAMSAFLDALDHAGLPPQARCLAALGPRMLELARERTAGVHPYLVTPEHTATARAALGPVGDSGGIVAPEQGVILSSDPVRARELARGALSQYSQYPNYRNNWIRMGFAEEEIDGMSDRLVDALFAWGDRDAIAGRIGAHRQAGADHVCVQAITGAGMDIEPALDVWRTLAGI